MRFIALTLAPAMSSPGEIAHVSVEHVTHVMPTRLGTRVNSANSGTIVVTETIEQVLELINGTDTATSNTHATPVRGLTELHLDDLAARVKVEVAWIESQGVVGPSPSNGWHKCHKSLVSIVRELRGEA